MLINQVASHARLVFPTLRGFYFTEFPLFVCVQSAGSRPLNAVCNIFLWTPNGESFPYRRSGRKVVHAFLFLFVTNRVCMSCSHDSTSPLVDFFFIQKERYHILCAVFEEQGKTVLHKVFFVLFVRVWLYRGWLPSSRVCYAIPMEMNCFWLSVNALPFPHAEKKNTPYTQIC